LNHPNIAAIYRLVETPTLSPALLEQFQIVLRLPKPIAERALGLLDDKRKILLGAQLVRMPAPHVIYYP